MRFPKVNKDFLPILGIVAFSACSVNAVANLFFERAKHDTRLFWIAAALVELCTAWLIWSVVETLRKVTKSNVPKQDKRFYSIILAVFLTLAIPSLSVSVIANVKEFGNVLLGLLFPTLSIACAVGSALPNTVKRYEGRKKEETEEAARGRKQRKKERQEEEERRQLLASLGKSVEVLRQLAEDPGQSQEEIGQAIGMKRRTVGYHLAKLAEVGAVDRDNGQVVVLWDLAAL